MIKQKIVKNTGIILRIRKQMPLSVLSSLYQTLRPRFTNKVQNSAQIELRGNWTTSWQ